MQSVDRRSVIESPYGPMSVFPRLPRSFLGLVLVVATQRTSRNWKRERQETTHQFTQWYLLKRPMHALMWSRCSSMAASTRALMKKHCVIEDGRYLLME